MQQINARYRKNYRAPDYRISDTHLFFDLDSTKTIVTAVNKVIRNTEMTVPLCLDGENLKLKSLHVNDEIWKSYRKEKNQLILYNLPECSTLRIVNEINPSKNTTLEGLYQSGEVLCTQCEAEGFRHITWYLDRPDVLAKFTTEIIADRKKYPFLLSNGNCVDHGEINGRHWIRWEDPFPKPCYLFALVAGDFDVLRDTFTTCSGRQIALELYVNRGNLSRASWAMSALKKSMKWDEDRFGLEYDLDTYMIVAVDFFNMGAMENKGLNVFNSKYILACNKTATDKDYLDIERVISHEYFHNWTGNRVTCRDWFQLSLKEGLTVFRDQEFSSDLRSRELNRIDHVRTMRGLQFSEDTSPLAHPIRPDRVIEMNNFYTLTVYEKGAEVVRMIHTLLGEINFQKGMQLYFKRYDGSFATCRDFVQAMEDASNIDLSHFFLWYSQSGTPIVTVKDNYNYETQRYTLTISQFTPPTLDQEKKKPLHIPFSIELYDENGKLFPLKDNGKLINPVLNLTQIKQIFTFDEVFCQPVPALLCQFSAPVKLRYDWSDQQLIFLIRYAKNAFSRWDAMQSLIINYIKINVNRYHEKKVIFLSDQVIDTFRKVLLDQSINPAVIAEMLTFPSISEIAEFFDVIDPDAIVTVRKELIRILTKELVNELLAIYNAHKFDEYRVEQIDIGRRSLRNVCLYYLAFNENCLVYSLVKQQYYEANNMTDILAALSAAVTAELPFRDVLMQEYDNIWHKNGLVMDKWFALQATSPSFEVLKKIRSLLNHRSFSIRNPNRVRSLIGEFANNNLSAFHAKDGSGYQFMVEILTILNNSNPQIASRLIEPLVKLKRYDVHRQKKMRTALEQLKKLENLSINLYEKITKALV